MDSILDNEDVLVDILSRLPAKTLLAFKCASKRLNKFIASTYFQRIYALFQQPRLPSGVFVQYWKKKEDLYAKNISTIDDTGRGHYIHLDEEPCKVQETMLNCLPEAVVLVTSCNGILCCRSVKKVTRKRRRNEQHALEDLLAEGYHDLYALYETVENLRNRRSKRLKIVIYICNPATGQWIDLGLKEYGHLIDTLGFIFYPEDSRFKLVGIQQKNDSCYFNVYSSETGKWKMSREVCEFPSELVPGKQIYVNGRLHWLAVNHHIVTFDVGQELSKAIKLPGTPIDLSYTPFGCLGDSEGVLHYVCAYHYEVKIWLLKDYSTPDWMLKCRLPLLEFFTEHPEICLYSVEEQFESPRSDDLVSWIFIPLAFHNDVLFFKAGYSIFSLQLKNGKVILLCVHPQLGIGLNDPQFPLHFVLPYRPTVASLCNFKGASVGLSDGCSLRRSVIERPLVPCAGLSYVKWKYPPYGWVKVNVCGGSVVGRKAGLGAVIRDCWGRWILGLCKYMEGTTITDSIVALSAVKEGLELTWERGCRRVILETDSREALDLVQQGCNGDSDSSPPVAHLVKNVKQLVERSWQVKFNEVPMEENLCALHLAKMGLGKCYVYWESPPDELAVLVVSVA